MSKNQLAVGDVNQTRFWGKVQKSNPDECWEWKNPTVNGYGEFYANGTRYYAHRVSFIIENGPITDGKWVLHRCGNRACVNPNHLYLGDHSDNMKDRARHNRHSKGECIGTSKLKESEVVSMREEFSRTLNYDYLAEKFSVSYATVQSIITGRTWKHAGGPRSSHLLSEEQVRDIRKRVSDRRVRQATLAMEFGVSQQTISDIIHYKRWKNI